MATAAIPVWITLDFDGARPMKVELNPIRVCREVVPAGIRYMVVVLDAEIPVDPDLMRAIEIDDREDGHATEIRKQALAWTEIEFVCQETRPMLDALANA